MMYPEKKLPRVISPGMLIASLCIHGLLLIALIVLYAVSHEQSKSQYINVGQVKLVEYPHQIGMVKKIKPATISNQKEPDLEPLNMAKMEKSESKPKTHLLTSKSLSPGSEQKVQIKKSKRKPQTLKADRKIAKDQNERKKEPKKSKNPDEIIEDRLAEIRQQVKKNHQENFQEELSHVSQPGGNHDRTAEDNAALTIDDPQLVRWLEQVKQRINKNWSILPNTTEFDKVTVIGVKMAQDGSLLVASVESSSGDELFDRSAMRAVHQASPYPPMPPKAADRIRIAGGLALRFTPGGLQ